MTTTVNYTEQETKYLIDAYQADPTKDCIEKFASENGKTARSVLMKLVSLGIYQKEVENPKPKLRKRCKGDVVISISNILGLDPSTFEGLQLAPARPLLTLEWVLNLLSEELAEGVSIGMDIEMNYALKRAKEEGRIK